MSSRSHILIAEEDSDYAFLIQLALKEAGVTTPVDLVTSRAETFAYLRGEGSYANRTLYPLPALILLGLRLPLLHDFDVLRWIREQPELHGIPVVVLSGVEYEEEARLARELGADCYRAKPFGFDQLLEMAKKLQQRWLGPTPPAEVMQKAA